MINVSREGVSFSYHGDVITRRWPWLSGDRYVSSLHATDFNHFREYWHTVGTVNAQLHLSPSDSKVVGLRLHEILSDYARRRFPGEHLAFLCEINPAARDSAFWKRIPRQQAEQLLKDVAVFRCKSREQMLEITFGTPTSFATAYAIEHGVLVDCNLWSDGP